METETTGQAPEQPERTIEDRAADFFGFKEEAPPAEAEAAPVEQEAEAEAAPEAEAEAPTDGEFEYELDGAKYVLPKTLEKAVMQQKDYTQKTQELAEQRRLIEARDAQIRLSMLDQSFSQEVAMERQQISMFDAALESAKTTDWAKMSTDEIIRYKLQIDQWKEHRDALQKQIDLKRGEFDNKVKAEIDQYREKAMDTLKKSIPNWSDDMAKQVRSHALQDGYTEAEVNALNDPRIIRSLWKAAQYDQMKAKASSAVKQVKDQPVKPTPSRPMDAKTKDYLNFRKTMQKAPPGSPERKAAIQNRIAGIFGD